MRKILTIQFRLNTEALLHEQKCIKRESGDDIELDFISALDDGISWGDPLSILEGYEAVILGGSGDLDFDGGRPIDDTARTISNGLVAKLTPLFDIIFERDIPTLGICYGHQIIGAFKGAIVHSDSTQKKTRSHEVRFIERTDNPLFADVPDSFFAHYGHKDVLDRVPEGALLLMSGGEECKVTALRYGKNIYTMQFHPELTQSDISYRMQNSLGYLPEGAVLEDLYKDDRNSNRILHNFAHLTF